MNDPTPPPEPIEPEPVDPEPEPVDPEPEPVDPEPGPVDPKPTPSTDDIAEIDAATRANREAISILDRRTHNAENALSVVVDVLNRMGYKREARNIGDALMQGLGHE